MQAMRRSASMSTQAKPIIGAHAARVTSSLCCDGSHKDTDITPVKYVADSSKRVFFCVCKASNNPPLCDGSHKKYSALMTKADPLPVAGSTSNS